MKHPLAQLQARRQQLLQQMAALDRLRRGSLSRQFFHRPGARGRQGPYYVLQGYFQGRKVSERVPAQEVRQMRPLVANYKRFVRLAEQVVSLTDQITRQSSGQPAPEIPPR